MRIYFSAAGQSSGETATTWHSKSYNGYEQIWLLIIFVVVEFLCYFIVNENVYELPTTKPLQLPQENPLANAPRHGGHKS